VTAAGDVFVGACVCVDVALEASIVSRKGEATLFSPSRRVLIYPVIYYPCWVGKFVILSILSDPYKYWLILVKNTEAPPRAERRILFLTAHVFWAS